jgi:hypothetical protein
MGLFSFLSGGCGKQPAPPSTTTPQALGHTTHATDDFAKLKETEHMLKWFADDPYAAMRSSIEDSLKQQVADSRLTALRVLSEPQWLTGALPSEGDSSKAILVRSGVAFEVALTVESKGQSHQLSGVFTWVAVHLDNPGQHKQRVWMDLDGKLEQFGSEGELKTRVYFE